GERRAVHHLSGALAGHPEVHGLARARIPEALPERRLPAQYSARHRSPRAGAVPARGADRRGNLVDRRAGALHQLGVELSLTFHERGEFGWGAYCRRLGAHGAPALLELGPPAAPLPLAPATASAVAAKSVLAFFDEHLFALLADRRQRHDHEQDGRGEEKAEAD